MSSFVNPAWLPFSVSEAVTAGDATGDDLESGRAWAHLLDTMRRTGDVVLSPSVPHNAIDMAAGFRHLLVLLEVGIDELLRRGVDRVPAVKPSSTDAVLKWGMECPDALYLGSPLSAGASYRLWGGRGSARYVGLQVMSGMASTSNALIEEFDLDPDGAFEIVLSNDHHDGNWLATGDDATMLIIRHFFYDWDVETAATVHIERTGGPSAIGPLATVEPKAAIARQMIALADYLEENLNFFLNFSKPEQPNTFLPPFDFSSMGAAAENQPVIGSWSLAAEDALIIEVVPPKGVYWSFSLGNPWWETIDYANHQSSLNGHQAVVDADGFVRVVVAHRDPGAVNWLDTAGHSEGPMILRCVRTASAPSPTTKVVPFSDVLDELPPDTRLVSSEERDAIIDRRRLAVSRRFPR